MATVEDVRLWLEERGRIMLDWRKSPYGASKDLFLGGIYVGGISGQPISSQYHPGEWRAWVMDDCDGTEHGWFPSPDDAMVAVERVVRAALSDAKRERI